jgi:glycosyltransferase involved in cell wall biosynthesis
VNDTQTPQKVFYVITKANFGGAQRYVFDLAKEAKERGNDVTVVYGEDGRLRELLDQEGIVSIRLESLGRNVSVGGDVTAFIELLRLFWNLRPDIIHLNSSKIGALGAIAGRLARVKRIIFTAHGWAVGEERPDWQKALIAFIHWWTVICTHTTIAVSEKTKAELADLPFMKRKIVVVHNAIKAFACYPQDEARKLLSHINTGAPIPLDGAWIGMIAELHPNKGVDIAVSGFADIANKHPEAHLVILGAGEKLMEIIEQIEKRGLGERVHLLGFVPDAGVYIEAFDILLFPSRKEGFPYAILEAGYAGVPVIASAVGGIPEAIKDMETGVLIHPKSPPEVTRALTMLLSDTARRATMAVAFQDDVTKRFTFTAMCDETFMHYRTD